MFEQAKEKAPCIVFIDEIDRSIASETPGLGGGHDKREQTLNQLLAEGWMVSIHRKELSS